jgi:hypothetical protein
MMNPIKPTTMANTRPYDLYSDTTGDPGLPIPPGPPGVPGIGDSVLRVFAKVFEVLGDLDLRGIFLYFYLLTNIINNF